MKKIPWLLVLLCGLVCAQESWLAPHVEKFKSVAADQIKKAKEELPLVKKSRVNAVASGNPKTAKGYVYRTGQDKKNAIAQIERSIKWHEDFLKGTISQFPDADLPTVGIGTVVPNSLRVMQVISPNAAIVDLSWVDEFYSGLKEIRQVKHRYVWLEASTSGWSDDGFVDFRQPMIVVGTKQYDTGSGSKTVPHLRALSEQDIADYKKLMNKKD